jgi:DHA1 family inner membrane transport protein
MDSGREKLLLYTLAAINFVHIIDFMIVMPLGPQLMKLLHISPAQFGMIVSAYTYSAGISSFVGASFIDRFGRKTALMFLFAGFIVGTFACGLSDSFGLLLAARCVTGAFGGLLGAVIFSIVGDVIPFERRSTAMGIVMSSFSVASVLGVPFGLFLATTYVWEAPFYFLGGIGILVFGLVWYVVPAMKGHISSERKGHIFSFLVDIFKQPNQLRALSLMGMLVLGQFTIVPFLATYFVFNVGFTEKQLTWIYLLGGAFTFFTSPWFGRMADRYGNMKIFSISAVLSLIPIIAITNMPALPFYWALIPTTLFFIFIGGRMVPAMGMITATVSPERRGSFMTVNTSVMQFMSGNAAFIGGLIITENADHKLGNYAYVGLIAVAASIACLFLARRIRIENNNTASASVTTEAVHTEF